MFIILIRIAPQWNNRQRCGDRPRCPCLTNKATERETMYKNNNNKKVYIYKWIATTTKQMHEPNAPTRMSIYANMYLCWHYLHSPHTSHSNRNDKMNGGPPRRNVPILLGIALAVHVFSPVPFPIFRMCSNVCSRMCDVRICSPHISWFFFFVFVRCFFFFFFRGKGGLLQPRNILSDSYSPSPSAPNGFRLCRNHIYIFFSRVSSFMGLFFLAASGTIRITEGWNVSLFLLLFWFCSFLCGIWIWI